MQDEFYTLWGLCKPTSEVSQYIKDEDVLDLAHQLLREQPHRREIALFIAILENKGVREFTARGADCYVCTYNSDYLVLNDLDLMQKLEAALEDLLACETEPLWVRRECREWKKHILKNADPKYYLSSDCESWEVENEKVQYTIFKV